MTDNIASAATQTIVKCGRCDGTLNVSWFCKNCAASLCDACANNHKIKRKYKSHAVVQRTYTVLRLYGPAKIAEQCKYHPEKEISAYCNKCDVPCCVSCLAKDHKRHDFSTIEDKYLDAEKSLNEYYKRLETEIRPKLDKIEEEVKDDAKEDDTHIERVISDINKYRKDVISNFNRACDDLISQVKNLQDKNNERFKEIESDKMKIESLQRKIEKKIESGKLAMIKYVPPKVESLIHDFVSPIKVLPWFEPDTNILDLINESVGKIHLKQIKKKDEATFSQKRRTTLNVKRINSFKCKIGSTSITKASDNTVWIMDFGTSTMHLYNDFGENIRSISVDDCNGMNGIAITKSGEIIITCDDNKVRRVSMKGKVSTLIDATPFVCEGVCLSDKEEIVVCMSGQEDQNHVAVYSLDGRRKHREIKGKVAEGKFRITDPYCVVQNGHDLCVVNTNVVVCVDERDDVRWLYKGKQAKLGKSFNPRGMCVDIYHCLLVTDNDNHCVHYIDRDGMLIQTILTHEQTGLRFPWGICVDDVTGYVWIGNSSKNVVIAKYFD